MRFPRIVKVDYIELWLHLVSVQMLEQVIIGNLGKVWKLVVVDIHGKAFLYLLLDIVVHDGI